MLIPEEYVADLSVRMGLYRRIGALANQAEINSFAAELVDRFGKMPPEAEFLLNTVALKLLCRAAGVDSIDAGEKAVVLSLPRQQVRPSPEKLIGWLQKNAPLVRLRPDHRVIVQRVWNDERQRLSGVTSIVSSLAKLAGWRLRRQQSPRRPPRAAQQPVAEPPCRRWRARGSRRRPPGLPPPSHRRRACAGVPRAISPIAPCRTLA